MILVNNSPCGPFEVEFSERERGSEKERDKKKKRERGAYSVTVIHFEYNQALLL